MTEIEKMIDERLGSAEALPGGVPGFAPKDMAKLTALLAAQMAFSLCASMAHRQQESFEEFQEKAKWYQMRREELCRSGIADESAKLRQLIVEIDKEKHD
jgi:hypothetical protein